LGRTVAAVGKKVEPIKEEEKRELTGRAEKR